MARKFRIVNLRIPQRKLPNRCIMCGRIIPLGYAICNSCNLKRLKSLRRRR